MWTRYLFTLWLILGAGVSLVHADGYVETGGSYTEGTTIRGNRYDVNGALKVTQATLTACEDQTNSLCMVSGGAVRQTTVTMGSAATTNATTAAFTIPTGSKSIYGQVSGTGAVTQTHAIYGDVDNDAANGILLCTITLSGTTRTQDACPVFTANFKYYYITTTNTTGTGATGAVYVNY